METTLQKRIYNYFSSSIKFLKRLRLCFIFSTFVFLNLLLFAQNNGDYRSKASGNWGIADTWEKWNGSSWITDGYPGSLSAINITIRSGHTVNQNLNYTSGSNNTIIIDNSGILNFNSSTGNFNFSSLTIKNEGLFIRNTSTHTHSSNVTIEEGGIYRHNINGGTIPIMTWDSGSTLEITGVTSTLPTASGTYQNVVWNSIVQNTNLIFEGNFNTINGNLLIKSTGSTALIIGNTSTARTITIGGDFQIEGGTFAIKGGTESAGNIKLLVNGNYIQTGGTVQLSRRASASTGTATLELKGNFSISAGTITNVNATLGVGEIIFSKIGQQYFLKTGGTISNIINFTIKNGANFDIGTSVIDGSTGTFVLESGAGLITANANGITSSGATGSIQVTGTRTYNTGANYIYNGSTAQISGNGLPATVNNLTINNSHASGVSLTNAISVNGTLILSNGILNPDGKNVLVTNTSENAVQRTAGYVSGQIRRTLPANASSGIYLFPVGKNNTYYPFTISDLESGLTSPVIAIEAFASNAGGLTGDVVSLSETEYWYADILSGNYTNGSISLGRESALGVLNVIARSNTQTGTYNSLNGIVSGTNINNSDATGSSLGYFLMANGSADCIAPTLNAKYNGEDAKTICAGEQYTLSANPSGGGNCGGSWEYAWFTGDGSGNTYWNGSTWDNVQNWGAYETIANVAPVSTITYKVKIRCSAETTCTSTDNTGVTVTVNSIPSAPSGDSPQTFCAGATIANLSVSGDNIKWYATSSGGDAKETSEALANGTYYASQTVNSCESTDRLAVTVSITPLPTISGTTPGDRCGEGTIQLSATPSSGDVRWYNIATEGVSLFTGSPFTTPSISSTTSYWVEAIHNGCVSSSRTEVVATVKSDPSITVQPVDANICETGQDAVFSVTASGFGTITYQWQEFDGVNWNNVIGEESSSLTVIAVNTIDASQYRCLINDEANCGPIPTNTVQINKSEENCADVDDYRTKADGNWNQIATWQRFNGSSWVDAVTTPTSANGVITIRHNVTVTANVTVDQVIIESGGILGPYAFSGTTTLTVSNGEGDDIIVYGTLRTYTGGSIVRNTGATTVVKNNGIYEHQRTGGSIPTATWETGSLCRVANVGNTSLTISNLGQQFYNLEWNYACSSDHFFEANPPTFKSGGTLTYNNSSTGVFGLVNTSNHRSWTIENLTVQNGVFCVRGPSGNEGYTHTLTINGNYVQTGGTMHISRNQYFGANYATLIVKGHFEFTDGVFGNQFQVPSNLRFWGNIAQTYTGTKAFNSAHIRVYVETDATIKIPKNSYMSGGNSGSGLFQLKTGATLIIGSENGIHASSTTEGAVRLAGTRTFSTEANYVYESDIAQITGNGLPATVNNLTIDNSMGVTLSSSVNVTNTLYLLSGVLTTNTSNIIGILNTSNSAISGASVSNYVNGPLQWTLPNNISTDGTSYFYPIGGNTTNYRPLHLQNIRTGATSPIVRISVSETGATQVDGTTIQALHSARNWYLQQISGNFISSTLQFTEYGLIDETHKVAKSNNNQSGIYSETGNTHTVSEGTITSQAGQTVGYYAIGAVGLPAIIIGSIDNFGEQCINTVSNEKSYTVSGLNLDDDITITPPAGFKISTTSGSSFQTTPIVLNHSGGIINETSIYVVFNPSDAQIHSEQIYHTSSGATTQNLTVGGTGTLPANPIGVSAIAVSPSQIDISFTPSCGENVIIAWNSTNTFGIPSGTYTPGDDISGGGKVLYIGQLSPFNHTGLSFATTYYYKVWTVYNTDQYSNGVTTNGTTPCDVLKDEHLPYFEGFEASTAPPTCWQMTYANPNPPAGNLITHSTTYAFSGSRSFRFSSYSSGAPYDQYLITPELNFSTDFTVSFRARRHQSQIETFAFCTSLNGTDWVCGSDITDAPNGSWKEYSFIIPAAVKYVRIHYKSVWQYYLYIDNFVIAPSYCSVSTFPWTETFEDDSQTKDCWVNHIESGDKNWTITTGAGATSTITMAQTGTKNARFTHIVPGGPTFTTKYISPLFNLTGLSNPTITFWYGQEKYYIANRQNELKVYYRTTTSDPWIELKHYPDNVSLWTKDTIFLPNPSATYQIAFEGIGKGGEANVLDNITIFDFPFVWTGLTSSDWNTASNWKPEEVPNAQIDIYIPHSDYYTYSPVINQSKSSPAECKNIEIHSGALLTIAANKAFTIYENIFNNGIVEIKSTAEGDASLLIYGNRIGSGIYKVNRYYTGTAWHMISSSITNAQAGIFSGAWIREYNESNNTWGTYITSPFTPLTTGKGYLVWTYNDFETRTYQGTINHGAISLPVQYTNNPELTIFEKGWNFVGNPYPSAIEWKTGTAWQTGNIAPTLYIWNPSSGNYVTWHRGIMSPPLAPFGSAGSGMITMGQGFFVQASGINPSISINDNARLHDEIAFRSTQTGNITIKVKGNLYSDQTIFQYIPYTSDNYELMYDASKLKGLDEAPQLYSKKQNQKVAVHTLNCIDKADRQIVYLETGKDGVYSIEFSHTYSDDIPMLYDRTLETYIAANTPYNFVSQGTDRTDRFEIVLRSNTDINTIEEANPELSNSIYIWNYDNILYIENTLQTKINVFVYNVLGMLILETNSYVTDLSKLPAGQYIVRVYNNKDMQIKKIIIQ